MEGQAARAALESYDYQADNSTKLLHFSSTHTHTNKKTKKILWQKQLFLKNTMSDLFQMWKYIGWTLYGKYQWSWHLFSKIHTLLAKLAENVTYSRIKLNS
ncbi:unnamed protein product [Clavelina lepadiformis]|uniref:Uncharacterized protein n=1 Tax=Clavelina lepadiformis TaxID=159417 RepID=A0ABP0EV05_CLALP